MHDNGSKNYILQRVGRVARSILVTLSDGRPHLLGELFENGFDLDGVAVAYLQQGEWWAYVVDENRTHLHSLRRTLRKLTENGLVESIHRLNWTVYHLASGVRIHNVPHGRVHLGFNRFGIAIRPARSPEVQALRDELTAIEHRAHQRYWRLLGALPIRPLLSGPEDSDGLQSKEGGADAR